MKPEEFVSSLRELRFENVFNPYADRCIVHDRDDGPFLRTAAFLDLLRAAVNMGVEALWVG